MDGYVAFARKQASLTGLLSAAFIVYMSYSFYTLYRVAVPVIPPLHRPDGSLKPTLRPLWTDTTFSLELYMTHTTPATPLHDKDNALLLHRWESLPYSDAFHADLDVTLHFEWTPAKPSNSSCTSCDTQGVDAAPNTQLAGLPPFPRPRTPARLVLTCAAERGVIPSACATAAAAAGNATGVTGVYSTPILAVFAGKAATRIIRALQEGGEVFSTIVARVKDDTLRAYGEHMVTLVASTPLTQMADYTPPKPLRYLWQDMQGAYTAEMYRNATVNASLPANAGLILRSQGTDPAPYRHPSSRDPSSRKAMPARGEQWPHWVGQLDVKLVMETTALPRDELPPAVAAYLRTDASRSVYAPLLTANPVRPTRERYHALNLTITSLPLRVSIAPLSHGSWQLLRVLDSAINTQKSMGASDADTDDVIRMFAETPIVLLAITLIVSCVHVLFDVLAFKNDASFWASARTLRGISVRSLSIQFGSQVIISAYLWSEGASLLVLVPQVAFTVLQVFKIAKAAGLVIDTYMYILPIPRFSASLAASTHEGETHTYDAQAVGYLSAALTPLVAGFALYAFIYSRFTGWTDFILSTGVSAVYTFGFVLMTPQLWINYKLKSVAHMPWRVLGYRFFNTIIDDVFAAIIKMPLMHRISVFRDDVVFVIYMYQRFLYRVDASRPAEGFDVDESAAEAAENLRQREAETQPAGGEAKKKQ